MQNLKNTCRIAVVQAAPGMIDKSACLEKAVGLIRECAANGAELIVFPELFLPGYPYGMTLAIPSAAGTRTGERTGSGTMTTRSLLQVRRARALRRPQRNAACISASAIPSATQ